MHNHFHDTYTHLDSPLHRAPAAIKLPAAIGLVTMLALAPSSPVFLACAGVFIVLLAAASNVPAAFLIKRLIVLEPFVFCAAALALFQSDGGYRFVALVARGSLCLLTMIVLTNTTPFPEILTVLRAVRVPALMLTVLALMHRYLYVLKDETRRMRTARQSRTFTVTRGFAWRSLASVIGALFARASGRADRIYNAMCARGWS